MVTCGNYRLPEEALSHHPSLLPCSPVLPLIPEKSYGVAQYLQEPSEEVEPAKRLCRMLQIQKIYHLPQIIHTGLGWKAN